MTIKSKYIKKILTKFPNSGDMTLAKLAIKEQPVLFESLDVARSMIRYYRGHKGNAERKKIDGKYFKPTPNIEFALPESHSVKRQIWRLPKANKKVLILSDIHFPYHDVEALTTALKYGKKQGIDTIFINGDMLDFYQLSFHEKDPRKTSVKKELQMGRDFFAMLKKEFPNANKYFIGGNHEYRLERHLKIKSPELLGIEEFQLDVLLKVREYDINYIPYGTKCYFGKLLVEHGDKLKGSGGVNPARTLYMRLKRHALCGHFHRTTESTEKIYDSDVIVTYSTGCLCELEPAYLEVNNHNHGFAIVEMNGDNFTVLNKKIIDGKVY